MNPPTASEKKSNRATDGWASRHAGGSGSTDAGCLVVEEHDDRIRMAPLFPGYGAVSDSADGFKLISRNETIPKRSLIFFCRQISIKFPLGYKNINQDLDTAPSPSPTQPLLHRSKNGLQQHLTRENRSDPYLAPRLGSKIVEIAALRVSFATSVL